MPNENNIKRKNLQFYAGIAGILAPIISSIMIYLALKKAQWWFHWRYNWLSDLGVHAESEIYFNSSLIVSGLLMILFSIGVYQYLSENNIYKIGKATLFIGSISLMMIGIFPEDVYPAHVIATIMFFSLVTFSIMTLGVGHVIERDILGIIMVSSSFLSILMWAIFWPGEYHYAWAGAIPEATSVAFLSLSIIALGYKMIKSA